jgi:hypothetical protein
MLIYFKYGYSPSDCSFDLFLRDVRICLYVRPHVLCELEYNTHTKTIIFIAQTNIRYSGKKKKII